MKALGYIIGLIILAVTPALCGERESGGGYGVHCSEKPLLVLDYVQATMIEWGKVAPEKPIIGGLNLVDQFNNYLDALINKIPRNPRIKSFNDMAIQKQDFRRLKRNIKRNWRKIGEIENWRKSSQIDPDEDTNMFLPGLPMSCKIVQLAKNYSDGTIEVDSKLIASMSKQQLKVLELHEMLYLTGRLYYGHKNSTLTRLVIDFLQALGSNLPKHSWSGSGIKLENFLRFINNNESFTATAEGRYRHEGNYAGYGHLPGVIAPSFFTGDYELEERKANYSIGVGFRVETGACPASISLQENSAGSIEVSHLDSNSDWPQLHFEETILSSQVNHLYPILYPLSLANELWSSGSLQFSMTIGRGSKRPSIENTVYRITPVENQLYVIELFKKPTSLPVRADDVHLEHCIFYKS